MKIKISIILVSIVMLLLFAVIFPVKEISFSDFEENIELYVDGTEIEIVGLGELNVSLLQSKLLVLQSNGVNVNRDNITSVIIGEGITSIGYNCFSDFIMLEKVFIGKDVKEIGRFAFYNCPMIKDINIPDNVKYIGEGAFGECYGLQKVNVGGGVPI